MPRISEFYGILIYMYFSDHAPPHFHAIYAQFDAEVEIATGKILAGSLSIRAQSLVREWAGQHRNELKENWIRARGHQPLKQIPPLD